MPDASRKRGGVVLKGPCAPSFELRRGARRPEQEQVEGKLSEAQLGGGAVSLSQILPGQRIPLWGIQGWGGTWRTHGSS